MTKHLSILGSTGSIGTQALEVVEKCGCSVDSLSAHRNTVLLEQQARQFLPRYVVIADEGYYSDIKTRLRDTNIRILTGMDGLCEAASLPETNIVLNALIGTVGILPTVAAIRAGKPLALANKETLVSGGEYIVQLAKQHCVPILPVDSEHAAIFQCLEGREQESVKKLILTASGGPFFGYDKKSLEKVTISQALVHPNWSMGSKITIDSATMMNKGLELIEAVQLFQVQPEQIEIVVHRESVIHSMVEFVDHSVLAQLAVPDMRIPIQAALTWPSRQPSPTPSLSLSDYKKLTFFPPDEETFSPIRVCREAISKGGLLPCAINAANEQAVSMFLKGQISFVQIFDAVEMALQHFQNIGNTSSLEQVLNTDQIAREFIQVRFS